LSTSPTSNVPHYMVEFRIEKQDTTAFGQVVLGMNFAMCVSYNNTGTGGGVQTWPPSANINNPNTWGYVPYSMSASDTPVPETVTVSMVLALSTVAVLAGSICLRKKSSLPKF
jgi:hypothetical protein